jgi:hypothetical protein
MSWPPKENSTNTPNGNANAEIAAAIFDWISDRWSVDVSIPALRRYSVAKSSGIPSPFRKFRFRNLS